MDAPPVLRPPSELRGLLDRMLAEQNSKETLGRVTNRRVARTALGLFLDEQFQLAMGHLGIKHIAPAGHSWRQTSQPYLTR
jgi:hypothetical protein